MQTTISLPKQNTSVRVAPPAPSERYLITEAHTAADVAEAQALAVRALAIFEKALGPQHPTTVICRENFNELTRKKR